MLQPALLGGVVIGVLSALPVINLANCCCAWILFGGGLAAYLLQQGRPAPISVGDGALVGLMAGAVGAVVWTLVSIPLAAVLSPWHASTGVLTVVFCYVFALITLGLWTLGQRGASSSSRATQRRVRFLVVIGALAGFATIADFLWLVGVRTPPVGAVLSHRAFWLIPLTLVALGVLAVAPAALDRIATGFIDPAAHHWSRFFAMSFTFSLAFILASARLVNITLDLLAERVAFLRSGVSISSEPPTPSRSET